QRSRRVDEQELDLHALRVLRDEDYDEDDEHAESPDAPVRLLALRLKVSSVGHAATLPVRSGDGLDRVLDVVEARRREDLAAARALDDDGGGSPESQALGLACRLGQVGVPAGRFSIAIPPRDVLDARVPSDRRQEGGGDVARVLRALVAVEELDVVPVAALLRRGQRRL